MSDFDGFKFGWMCFNFVFWVIDEEVDFLFLVIEFVVEYGEKFLLFYDFDWKIGVWMYL